MSPDQIVDALVTVVTAAIGYGALRTEIRALRADLRQHKADQQRQHDEHRSRLAALERVA